MSSFFRILWLLAALLLTSATLIAADTAPLSSKLPQGDPDDIYWDSTIANSNGGLNGPVTALTVYDGKLIVAGDFTTAGGITVNHIAAWDGSSWSSLGSGMNSVVSVLTVCDNKLIAGGEFTTADGDSVNHIAAWDGTDWSSLDSGLDGIVTALTVDNGELIAGHNVVWGADVSSWDGSTWSTIYDVFVPFRFYRIAGLTVYQGQLIASIRISSSPITYGNAIAWDDNTWSGIPGGGGPLVVVDNKLILSTLYDGGQGDVYVGLLSWDGSSSTSILNDDFGQYIQALAVYDNHLIAGGRFADTGLDHISTWDGLSWSALGSGLNYTVTTLTVYDGKLVVGGSFTTAGSKVSPYLAVWTKRYLQCGDADGSGEVNLVDIVYVVNWMFVCGPAPLDEAAGDYNCDGRTNIADVVYLVNYVFRGGPKLCEGCK